MAEFVVRTQDKELTGNVYHDRNILMAGDVVVVMEDGHQWSKAEREAPFWLIVKVPGVPVSAFADLVEGDTGHGDSEAMKMNRVLRRRVKRLDVDALKLLMASPVKAQEIATNPAKAVAHLTAVKQNRPVLADPRVFGEPQVRGVVFG